MTTKEVIGMSLLKSLNILDKEFKYRLKSGKYIMSYRSNNERYGRLTKGSATERLKQLKTEAMEATINNFNKRIANLGAQVEEFKKNLK